MADDYRIEFQIQRRREGEDDFTEIGFGSSGAWRDLPACTHSLDSGVSNGEWETEPGQPDPSDVMAEIGGRVERVDKYTINVAGAHIVADAGQERRIRAMTPEQRDGLGRILGKKA